ncbi:MAG: hypothetical protein AAF390_07650 [Pseudomonadota bacterium]
MAWDYLEAGRYIRNAMEAGDLRLRSGAPFEHGLCHGVELALKSLLLMTDDQFEPLSLPPRERHDLRRLRELASDRPEVRDADAEMVAKLAKIERGDLTTEEAVRRLNGEPVDPTIGDGHGIAPEDLFTWYRDRHMESGGWFRYPKNRAEPGPAPRFWKPGGQGAFRFILLRPLALETWLEAFLTRVEEACLPSSPAEAT